MGYVLQTPSTMPATVGTTSQLRVGDVLCATVKDKYFSTLRQAHDVPNDFLDGQFDFGKLAGGGGKGGDLMSRTFDGAMFVKQLNHDDARSLLRDEFLEAYVDRLMTVRRPASALVRPHLLFWLSVHTPPRQPPCQPFAFR